MNTLKPSHFISLHEGQDIDPFSTLNGSMGQGEILKTTFYAHDENEKGITQLLKARIRTSQ